MQDRMTIWRMSPRNSVLRNGNKNNKKGEFPLPLSFHCGISLIMISFKMYCNIQKNSGINNRRRNN
jgi:hypothetical protein